MARFDSWYPDVTTYVCISFDDDAHAEEFVNNMVADNDEAGNVATLPPGSFTDMTVWVPARFCWKSETDRLHG